MPHAAPQPAEGNTRTFCAPAFASSRCHGGLSPSRDRPLSDDSSCLWYNQPALRLLCSAAEASSLPPTEHICDRDVQRGGGCGTLRHAQREPLPGAALGRGRVLQRGVAGGLPARLHPGPPPRGAPSPARAGKLFRGFVTLFYRKHSLLQDMSSDDAEPYMLSDHIGVERGGTNHPVAVCHAFDNAVVAKISILFFGRFRDPTAA